MSFSLELSEEHKELQEWVRGFAEKTVRPAAAEWDEREETPWPIIQEAAKVGLYGFESLANFWADETGLSLPIVNEELFWGDGGIGMAIFGTTLAVAGIFAAGTPDQLAEWVPQCYGDENDPKVAAFCSSEPGAGSDVSAMRTRAVYDEAKDEWVLNGTKAWITNGGIADVHVVVAAVDPELKGRGQASFVVPPGTKGLSQGQKYKKHGIRASHTAEVVLDDCKVPSSMLLGGREKLEAKLARAREGQKTGEKQPAMATFEATRPAVAAMAVGIARAAYEEALAYARERKSLPNGDFGRSAHQSEILMAAAVAARLSGVGVIPKEMSLVSANAVTDLSAAEALTFVASFYKLDPRKVGHQVAVGSIGSTTGFSSVRPPRPPGRGRRGILSSGDDSHKGAVQRRARDRR